MELTRIAPDVHVCLQPDRGLGWSNSGLIDRGGGLVVDTFWDLPRTRGLMELYAAVSSDPVRRLVNTHHNGDHCWGNQLFAEAGAEIIGHRLCAEMMVGDLTPEMLVTVAENPPPQLTDFAAALGAFDFTGIELTPPTTLIDERLRLDLDGTPVDVIYVGPAHTAGDVIVHLPEDGVVFTGDILFHQCTPIGWEGTTARWVEALETIEALEPAIVVPGHGPLAGVEGVRAMRDYLAYVLAEARVHFEAGRSPLEAAKLIELGPYAGWNEPERLAFNVARAYRELRGGEWNESVDVLSAFDDVRALREYYAGQSTAN
jgi:glyoxylase-like metal-dependent hydrolase (beta-lactamase superfamily II)